MSDGGENKRRRQVQKRRKNSDSDKSNDAYEKHKPFNNSDNSIEIPNDIEDQIDEEMKSILKLAEKKGLKEKYEKLCADVLGQKGLKEEQMLDKLYLIYDELKSMK